MNAKNKLLSKKFEIKQDEINNNKEYTKIIRTEGNRKVSTKNNKNRPKSNPRSFNNDINTTSPKNKSHNMTKNIFNQKILEIIRYTEDELGSLDSEKHIQSAVKILENFQKELIEQLEQEYDENSIKKVLQTNFDKIIKLLIKYFTLYDKNCSNCVTNLSQMLNSILNTNLKIFESNNNLNLNIEDSSLNKSTKYNSNISYLDEDKKKEFLNEEEIIVGLINSLSGGIKICNKNYRTKIFDIAKLIEKSNNDLIELKNKFDKLSNQLKMSYVQDIQYKKNTNLLLDNIANDVENLYSMNIDIIEDVKLLDSYQNTFYDDAKKIFNQLKINHSKKLKEFHLLFQSISIMPSNISNSQKIINKRGKSISGKKTGKNKFLDEDNYGENDGIYNSENRMNRNNSSKNFIIKNNYSQKMNNISENLFNEENNNITIFVLAEEVLEFFNKMKNLQECIVKKVSGTNQMKLDFERYKKKLIKLLNNIINNKNKENINQYNNSKLTNISDNNIITSNKKNNIQINYQTFNTMLQVNNKIIQVEQFQINSKIKKKNKKIDNNNDEEISNDLQAKYNNLLEEINNKSQELNKLQDQINKLLSENKELISKNKKLDKENQALLSKVNNITNIDKKNDQNNFSEFEKINIDDIISSPKNTNDNHNLNSNHELFKLTDYEAKLKQENKKLKDLISKCINIIFDSIKETSPNMIEDNIINDEIEVKIKINKNNNQEESEEEEFDMEYINNAVKKFQTFNQEMSKNLKKAEEDKQKYEKEAHENMVKAQAYKNALDKAINQINLGEDGNNSDLGEKTQNKRQFTFDGEGEISFKDNFENIITNNKYIKNIKEENLNKKNNDIEININNNENNNINEEINKILIESNKEENNNEKNMKKMNNEEANKVNKDLLKVQQKLIEKIKSLEEEIEKNKTTIHNLFIESANELYDINEMTVSMTKYNRLLKLLETEQERNKNLEEKYISFINEITENLSLNNHSNISDKLKDNINMNMNKKDDNNIDDENIEFEDHSNKNKNKINNNKKINQNRTYGELNAHNENYLSLLNKGVNINGDEEENVDENDDIKMNKSNSGIYKSQRMQELVEENKDLKEKETLLFTQLDTIKQELKETRYFLDEMKNKNLELAQEIESQGTLRNKNLIGSLRNCLERLITEIKITNKVKEILIVMLRLASYTDEQIETIFKYKEKKKNIINIFQME